MQHGKLKAFVKPAKCTQKFVGSSHTSTEWNGCAGKLVSAAYDEKALK